MPYKSIEELSKSKPFKFICITSLITLALIIILGGTALVVNIFDLQFGREYTAEFTVILVILIISYPLQTYIIQKKIMEAEPDEREKSHDLISSKIALYVVGLIIVANLIWHGFSLTQVWAWVALVAGGATKLIVYLYLHRKR